MEVRNANIISNYKDYSDFNKIKDNQGVTYGKAYFSNFKEEKQKVDEFSRTIINSNSLESNYTNSLLDKDKTKSTSKNINEGKGYKVDGKPTKEEAEQVKELKARDAEVRAHEQAHIAAAGGIAVSGPTYTYQTGPDGQKYAIGGEVNIDMSPESEPEATIRKMQQVRRAALAPADPSPQDRAVASAASQIEAQARQELLAKKYNGNNLNQEEESSKENQSNKSLNSINRLA
jgi:hypothetical protein